MVIEPKTIWISRSSVWRSAPPRPPKIVPNET